jgi:hypothetical protein
VLSGQVGGDHLLKNKKENTEEPLTASIRARLQQLAWQNEPVLVSLRAEGSTPKSAVALSARASSAAHGIVIISTCWCYRQWQRRWLGAWWRRSESGREWMVRAYILNLGHEFIRDRQRNRRLGPKLLAGTAKQARCFSQRSSGSSFAARTGLSSARFAAFLTCRKTSFFAHHARS